MDFIIGLLLGIVALAAFGFQDFVIAKSSRVMGVFRTSLWFQLVTMATLLGLSLFLFHYQPVGLLTLAVVMLASFLFMIVMLVFTKGLEIGNVSIVATIANSWGAVTAILGVVFLGNMMTGMQAFYIATIIAGTVLASLNLRQVFSAGASKLTTSGIEHAIATMMLLGIFFFLVSYLTTVINWFSVSLFITFFSILFTLVYCVLTKVEIKPVRKGAGLLIAGGVIGAVAGLAYNLGVTYNYASIVAPVAAASPIVTVVLALIFMKERLALDQKVGIVLVLAGIVLLAV
ncbi:MAG: DMT family transporter [Candidatus Micrarchaeota archaeon]|nr:DMT family transporter [Candidatus Micrarchaeota archaeon]